MTDDERLAFRLDCGATWLNLLATRGRTFGERPVERIATPERLGEWLEHSEMTPVRPPEEADARQARALRETLRPLALAVAGGERPPAGAAAELVHFLDGAPDPVRLVAADRLLRDAPATTADALARIARQAVDHLTGPERHTLAVCPEHDCRGVFANPTGRRRWCPSPACASRGRVRALRERRRAAADHRAPPVSARTPARRASPAS
ncbi:ABATE domain-containing protein [Streptomyces sp. ISL-11]|uniref:CGNR zinc finger domain-containing protein n=1 Tax=Streptomyces sp. ISL-11 TaxID=2819174 RepID=UPI001BEC4997|nr:CGNR zinc finger domain-containing protein [Streptomyces sp. ISL-11]MBT2386271.1 CGNR zinc finger domain-containing protein [Streptomyces sp. ISL-11]